MPDPRYTSTYTGQQVESAITKALQIDDFEYVADEIINGTIYHVLWKVRPTVSNTVSGFTVDPTTGDICQTVSVDGVKAV